jgi:undecaprenyl-diphosphatase
LSWILLLCIAYGRHVRGDAIRPSHLAAVAAAAFAVAGFVETSRIHESDLARYAYRPRSEVVALDDWLSRGWQTLPAQRVELDGDADEPFSIQWADSVDGIGEAAGRSGWAAPAKWSALGVLHFLVPNEPIASLPVVPKLHEGQPQTLAFQKVDGPDRRLVLRLWRTQYSVAFPKQASAEPLWLGTLEAERVVRRRSVLSLADEDADPRAALDALIAASDRLRAAIRTSPGRSPVVLIYRRR